MLYVLRKHIHYSILMKESQVKTCVLISPQSGGNPQSGKGTEKCLYNLACKHAPQVAFDAPDGNRKKDEQQADKQA